MNMNKVIARYIKVYFSKGWNNNTKPCFWEHVNPTLNWIIMLTGKHSKPQTLGYNGLILFEAVNPGSCEKNGKTM